MINRADFDDFVTKKETEAEVPKRFRVTDLMQKSSGLKSALSQQNSFKVGRVKSVNIQVIFVHFVRYQVLSFLPIKTILDMVINLMGIDGFFRRYCL